MSDLNNNDVQDLVNEFEKNSKKRIIIIGIIAVILLIAAIIILNSKSDQKFGDVKVVDVEKKDHSLDKADKFVGGDATPVATEPVKDPSEDPNKKPDVVDATPTPTKKTESVDKTPTPTKKADSEDKTPTPTKKPAKDDLTVTPTKKPADSKVTPSPVKKPEEHKHSFKAATCTEAKKCSCGATEGKPLGHDFGKNNEKCSRCGVANPNYKKPEAHVHKFSAATCTEAKKCSCGATEGKPLGHDFGKNNEKCSRCGANNPNYKPANSNVSIGYSGVTLTTIKGWMDEKGNQFYKIELVGSKVDFSKIKSSSYIEIKLSSSVSSINSSWEGDASAGASNTMIVKNVKATFGCNFSSGENLKVVDVIVHY